MQSTHPPPSLPLKGEECFLHGNSSLNVTCADVVTVVMRWTCSMTAWCCSSVSAQQQSSSTKIIVIAIVAFLRRRQHRAARRHAGHVQALNAVRAQDDVEIRRVKRAHAVLDDVEIARLRRKQRMHFGAPRAELEHAGLFRALEEPSSWAGIHDSRAKSRRARNQFSRRLRALSAIAAAVFSTVLRRASSGP